MWAKSRVSAATTLFEGATIGPISFAGNSKDVTVRKLDYPALIIQ